MSLFRMPSLGADMDEGTVLEWLVAPGDTVQKGDIVAIVDTAKSAVDVETFDSGTVQSILVPAGERVAVGTPLAEIASADAGPEEKPAKPPTRARRSKRAKHPEQPEQAARSTRPPQAPAVPGPGATRPEPQASPVVRRFARTSGVDLAAVHGTGPNGRITHDDVARAAAGHEQPVVPGPRAVHEAAAPARGGRSARVSPYARQRARELGVDPADLVTPGRTGPLVAADVEAAAAVAAPARAPGQVPPSAAPPGPGPAERAAAMRSAIARLMARSKREVPHYYLTETFDLSAPASWLRQRNDGLPVRERLVMAALLAKATAVAARRVPQLNGFWVDDEFRPADGVHLGVAVSLRGGGLVTPAIHDADLLTPPELMAALRDVVERARRGVLHRGELTDGTLTMTNLGERGAESVLGVIFPPQVALVGFGRVVDRPVAVDGLIGIHPTVDATLSGDHRASDGHVGGTFLALIGELLERPEDL